MTLAVAVANARAQAPVRTRDVGFATVAYDNGQTFGAITLNELATIERPSGSLTANALLSLFNDGRWSMQGFLAGSRLGTPIETKGPLRRLFPSLQGELGLAAAGTAQYGFMPTLQVNADARVHLTADGRGVRGGGSIARTFDGIGWRTTVIGDLGGWLQLGSRTELSASTRPMQLQFGDLLSDSETNLRWTRGRTTWEATAGLRVGEADREPSGWGSLSVSWPIVAGLSATFSGGTYPIDLIQGLPGGTYGAFAIRLPDGRFPRRTIVPPVPVRRIPVRPDLPTTEPLTLVIGESLDSLDIREIRVWAPGVREVELIADFVDWIPVPLVRQPNGEWQGYYRVPSGLHRLNLRLDRRELAVPRNLAKAQDEFSGEVGLVVVR